VGKAALGEEAADLHVRVDARLELPEKLQDNSLVVGDRRVALLGPQH
jgi:hypothetical protein